MGMGGMLDVLFLASGAYLIFTAVMSKRNGKIAANVMLSKGVSEKDIADKAGFIQYIYKRIIVAGVLIMAASAVHFVNDYYIHSTALTWLGIGVILFAIALYSRAYKCGQKQYISKADKISKKADRNRKSKQK